MSVESVGLHRGRERVQCLVEIVHLRENAEGSHDGEHISGSMNELVIAAKCQLERDAESLDRHDGHGADGGADRDINERVLLAIDRRNPIYHHSRENRNR